MQPYLGPFSAILDPKVPFLGWIACSRALAVVSVPPCVKWAWLAVCGSPKPGVAASGCQRAVFLRLARIRALKLCLKTLKIARILIQQLISRTDSTGTPLLHFCNYFALGMEPM